MVNVLAYVVLWLTCLCGLRARLCGIMVSVLASVVLWLTCLPLWYYG